MTSADREQSLTEMEIMKSFFEYWDNLGNFATIGEDANKALEQDVRGAIIDILALGIPDVDPMTDHQRRRHVLNARELLDQVNERLDQDIKKSNLYFHLQKLEDVGLIKVVDQIPRGKQYTTYYGRTAKAFLRPDMKIHEDKLLPMLSNDLFAQLIDKINPDLTRERVDQIITDVSQSYETSFPQEELGDWLETHQQNVLELDIDVRRLFDAYRVLAMFSDETVSAMRKLADALHFRNIFPK